MLALTLVFAASLYLVGLRADRIHAGRAVSKVPVKVTGRAVTEPDARTASSAVRREPVRKAGLPSGSVTAQRSDGTAALTATGSVSSVSAHLVSRPVPVRHRGLSASEWAAKYRQMRTLAHARPRGDRSAVTF